MPTIHVSTPVRDELKELRDEREHTSYDSLLRELLRDVHCREVDRE